MNSVTSSLIVAGAFLAISAAGRADSEKAAGYELKNRSAFRASDDARIPFWPIGFQRPKIKSDGTAAARVVVASKIHLEPEYFSVTSILLGNPALATINGRSFEEGEILPVIFGTERLRVVVRAIRDGGVNLEYDGQQVVVPLKRPELGAKRAQQKAEPSEFLIKVGPLKEK